MKIYYKIVLKDKDSLRTVHNGIKGNRTLPVNSWITAERKQVKDGGRKKPYYLSGIHVLPTQHLAEEYMKRFKRNRDDMVIVPCLVKGIRCKSTNPNVRLVNQIKILQ